MYDDGPIFLAVNDPTYFAFYRELMSVWTLNLSCSRLSAARDERKGGGTRAKKEACTPVFARLFLAFAARYFARPDELGVWNRLLFGL